MTPTDHDARIEAIRERCKRAVDSVERWCLVNSVEDQYEMNDFALRATDDVEVLLAEIDRLRSLVPDDTAAEALRLVWEAVEAEREADERPSISGNLHAKNAMRAVGRFVKRQARLARRRAHGDTEERDG